MDIPRLHPDTVEEVKQRVDILDIISEQVVLRKRGKDYLGLCPFHSEKTPSFTVSPSKQLYHCFGCGAGGNAITFLQEINQSSFAQVVLDLARRYQIRIKTLEPQQTQELQRRLSLREQLYEILAVTASFYQHALRQPQGKIALDYLHLERHLTPATVEQWQLGYAPGGWETLYRYLVEAKRYSVALVEQAGLIKQRKSGNGYYDVFRDRLMIPINDSQGRIIGFGSRTLADEQPKYLNSPETQLFDKSKTLFALDRAKGEIAKQDRAIVVEGYFDVIALHSHGITNAVASLGTAFTQEQLKQLLRYSESKQVILNFDADGAGTKATQRTISDIESLIYSGLVQVRVLNLPDGKDADEFLHSHPEAVSGYRQLLKDAPLWLDWQLQQILQGKDLNQGDQYQQVAKQMVNLLNRLGDPNQRTHYVSHCAQLLAQGDARFVSIQANNLLAQLKKPRLKNTQSEFTQAKVQSTPQSISTGEAKVSTSQAQSKSTKDSDLLRQVEALLLIIYIHLPEYRQEIFQLLEQKDLLFNFSHHRFLWQQIMQLQGEEAIRTQSAEFSSLLPSNQLVSRLQDLRGEFPEQINQVANLFVLKEKIKEDMGRTPLTIRAAVATMELVGVEKYKRYCLEQLQKLDPVKELERYHYYGQEILLLYERIQKLKNLRQCTLLEATRIS